MVELREVALSFVEMVTFSEQVEKHPLPKPSEKLQVSFTATR